MSTPTLTLDERADRLEQLAIHVAEHTTTTPQADETLHTLTHPDLDGDTRAHFTDLVDAITTFTAIDTGTLDPAEHYELADVPPDRRHDHAWDMARQAVEDALWPLLHGPAARRCTRCKQVAPRVALVAPAYGSDLHCEPCATRIANASQHRGWS